MPWCPNCGAEYREGFSRCSECGVALVAEAPGPPRIGPQWLSVAVFTTVEEARLARGLLRELGVAAEILDREMHAAPYGMALLGEIELLVPPGDEARARELLKSASEAEPDAEGPDGEAGP